MRVKAAASYDIVILGGGPAGSATALSLRVHAPDLRVAIVDGVPQDGVRIGETLPPFATALLEHLDVASAFAEQRHRMTHGTAAAWGGEALVENDFLYSARGPGWHLDRAAFDAMLLREAERREVTVIRGRVATVVRNGADWQLILANDDMLSARFVVDATGASAALSRRLGARPIAEDRLVGFSCFFETDAAGDQRTLVESFADGWWYTASLPDGRRVVACMTDADIARRLELSDHVGWSRQLAQTHHTAATVRDATSGDRIVIRAARSRRLATAVGDGWLAVGDAASSVDPLSSQGISRALRSGIFASYAIGDAMVRGVPDALRRYEAFVTREFTHYLSARAKYYALEQRWPSSAFWQRRQS